MIYYTINVKTKNKKYKIFIGYDLIDLIFQDQSQMHHLKKIGIITDKNLHSIYANRLNKTAKNNGVDAKIFCLPSGEKFKTRKSKEQIEDFLLENQFDRTCSVIAFGGGVIGDLTGFTASTFYRSIPYAQIPTSIISQVDSSVGGKTGLNTKYGKNLIGTFYQPEAVYIDLMFLESLPDTEFQAGMAEVLKYAIIEDTKFFDYLENNRDLIFKKDREILGIIIKKCIMIKKKVVEKDETEKNLRKILNFGHTVGHAIEKTSNHTILHGQAVALGMIYEAKIANMLNILSDADTERIIKLIKSYKFDTIIPKSLDAGKIHAATLFDKKAVEGIVYMSLPRSIGKMYQFEKKYVIRVSKDIIEKALGL